MINIEGKVISYADTLLKRGQKFAMKLGTLWVFGIVRDYEDVGPFVYDRINEMKSGASQFSIGSGSDADYNRLRDSNNEDIFWEEDEGFILHAFIGIDPPDLRLFTRYPSPVIRGNLSKIKVTGINAEAKGYVDGNVDGSPFDLPTNRTELLIPTELEVDFGLYNPLGRSVVPALKIFIRRYQVQFYDPENKVQSEIIKNIINGNFKCHWWSPGIDPFNYDIESNLGIKGVEVDWMGK
jgi:hypothetical protein